MLAWHYHLHLPPVLHATPIYQTHPYPQPSKKIAARASHCYLLAIYSLFQAASLLSLVGGNGGGVGLGGNNQG